MIPDSPRGSSDKEPRQKRGGCQDDLHQKVSCSPVSDRWVESRAGDGMTLPGFEQLGRSKSKICPVDRPPLPPGTAFPGREALLSQPLTKHPRCARPCWCWE